jgi:MFS family permease
LVTVFAVVYAVGAPTLSVLCERSAKRTVLVAGLLLFVLANVAAALAPGYWFLMGARVAAALCTAVVASAAFATAAAGAPDGEQGRYLGVVTAGMTAALFSGYRWARGWAEPSDGVQRSGRSPPSVRSPQLACWPRRPPYPGALQRRCANASRRCGTAPYSAW